MQGSGVATLGHAGARALATSGRAPPVHSGRSRGGGGGGRGVQMHPPFEGLPSRVLSKPAQT